MEKGLKIWCSGNATLITCHVFRIFDLDRNDYLDFKEFLLAIDVAMRLEQTIAPFIWK